MLALWLMILALALGGVIYLGAVFAGLALAAGRMHAHIAADPDATHELYREAARTCARNARIALTLAITGAVLLIALLMR
jgi:hypothetical protein